MLTVYNSEEDTYQKVEEPDSSLTYTYADYLKWQFEERLELFRGKIFKLSAPNTRHQTISGELFLSMGLALRRQPCKIFAAPFDVRLPVQNKKKDHEVTTVVQPDLCIICDESKLDARGCCGAPDLVVEILSPGNTEKEVKRKRELYEEAGVQEYWIVYPAEENIAVLALNNEDRFEGAKLYTTNDTIYSSAVPGLVVHLKDIFRT